MKGEYRFEPPPNIPGGAIVIRDALWRHCESCGEDILSSELEAAGPPTRGFVTTFLVHRISWMVTSITESNVPTSSAILAWILRVATWDGLFPALVWSAPVIVQMLHPNRRGPVEVTAVVLPIIAFLVRFNIGRGYILSNDCRTATQRLQMAVLCVGIFALVLVDAVIILIHIMPKGAALATTGDMVVWGMLYSAYVLAMSIAMYPGVGTKLASTSTLDRSRTKSNHRRI